MDLIDRIRQVAGHVIEVVDYLETEEETKNASVFPFLEALGYNPRNPKEVKSEYSADVATKKAEKVDYAIMHEGEPAILVECKRVSEELKPEHTAQLFRYFSVTPAKFGILTNGMIYRFYSDFEAENLMDAKPFAEIDLRDLHEPTIQRLKGLTKSGYEPDAMRRAAEELRYTKGLKEALIELWETPSPEFVKVIAANVHDGRWTVGALERFRPMVKRALHQFVNEIINTRLSSAMSPANAPERGPETTDTTVAPEDTNIEFLPEGVVAVDGDIVTTQDEVEAFELVRTLVGEVIDPDRVFMRDAKSYCAVLVDNNNRRPICRLKLDGKTKYIILFDSKKSTTRVDIKAVKDIYRHAPALRTTAATWK